MKRNLRLVSDEEAKEREFTEKSPFAMPELDVRNVDLSVLEEGRD